MLIGIDGRPLLEKRPGGVKSSAENLLTRMFEADSKNEYRIFCNAWRKQNFDFSVFSRFSNVKICEFHWPNKLLNFSLRFFNWPKIDKMLGGIDVFFAPNIMFFGLSKKCRFILVLHDLSFEYYAKFLGLRRRLWHFFINPKKWAYRASKIICPSFSTKNDLIRTYGLAPEKIEVVYWGVDIRGNEAGRERAGTARADEVREKYHLPEKFILSLGTFEPRKNLIGTITAFAKLKKEGKPRTIFSQETHSSSHLPVSTQSCYSNMVRGKIEEKLVLAGGGGWKNKAIFRAVKASGVREDIVFVNNIAEKDKQEVYKLASLFLYPSFYEGFGFPPLEAQMAGTPVITSACSSLPEIVGNAAVLVNPYNTNEIAKAIEQVLTDKNLRENLARRGNENIGRFSWEIATKKFQEIINSKI